MTSKDYVKIAYEALDDKKGHNIRIIDISTVSMMGDYLVIADGDNKNLVQALCDNVEEKMSEVKLPLKHREGYANGGWILLDYCDIIVHVFTEEARSFYDLEHIWRDGNICERGDL